MALIKDLLRTADWKQGKYVPVIEAYFQPKGEKFPYQIGRFGFGSPGESV